MTIQDATREYESWLGGKTPLDFADIECKHERMSDAGDPFPCFRGTYYRRAQRWSEVCSDLADAPHVLAVGDLHVENFGTWRNGSTPSGDPRRPEDLDGDRDAACRFSVRWRSTRRTPR